MTKVQTFIKKVTELAEKYEATKDQPESISSYEWKVMTKVGYYIFSVHNDPEEKRATMYSIMGRFEDYQRAGKFYTCNTFNGKYNFHQPLMEVALSVFEEFLESSKEDVKTYKIPMKFIFPVEFFIRAESKEQAHEFALKDCGMVAGGNIHSTLAHQDVSWEYNTHPEKVIGLTDDMINVINVLKSFKNNPPDVENQEAITYLEKNIDHMVNCICDELSPEDKKEFMEIFNKER